MAVRQNGVITRARIVLFWLHLASGVIAGAAIFTMSVTGAALALQPQILEWLESDQRAVVPPHGAERLSPSALLNAATRGERWLDAVSLTQSAHPDETAIVSLGRDRIRYVDPYRGTVIGEGAGTARDAFRWLTEFHRWFATPSDWRNGARAVTGWSTFAFAVLIVSGAVLWIPRSVSAGSLVRAVTPAWPATTRARHFNWHTVAGLWCAPILLVLATTGVVLAMPWANRLLYTAAGSTLPPARAGGPTHEDRRAQPTRPVASPAVPDYRPVDAAWAVATARIPSWETIVVRIPPRVNGPLSFTITDAAHWNRFARSQMIASGTTGELLQWEPYNEISRGQKWRGWVRFAHTGELGGLAGQVLAGTASAAAAVLVWTGISLAVGRFIRSRGVVRSRVDASRMRPTRTPVTEPIRQVEQG
jgi:uncharacterized iron-regulated membrane protein